MNGCRLLRNYEQNQRRLRRELEVSRLAQRANSVNAVAATQLIYCRESLWRETWTSFAFHCRRRRADTAAFQLFFPRPTRHSARHFRATDSKAGPVSGAPSHNARTQCWTPCQYEVLRDQNEPGCSVWKRWYGLNLVCIYCLFFVVCVCVCFFR